MMQRYTSARTSRSQVPALHRALMMGGVWLPGAVNADIGGGKFDLATIALREVGVENLVYDPYNRTAEHNERVMARMLRGCSTATVANVLCVIAEDEARASVVELAARTAPDAFFDVYEGNGSGQGGETRDGWQENRSLDSYVSEIKPFFRRVSIQRIGRLRVLRAER